MGLHDIERVIMEWQRKVSPAYSTCRLTFPRDTEQAQAVNLIWALAGVQMPRNQAFVLETYGCESGWWQYLSVPPAQAANVQQLLRTNIKGVFIEDAEDITG